MVHTREGAYTALHCIWHSTPKDRRTIIKSFKTFMMKTAQEDYGHMVLLGIFDCVDDTKVVGNAVVGELMKDLDTLFSDKYGIRVLKYLFGRRDPTYISKEPIAILEKGDGNAFSKKDADTRHKELVDVASTPVLKYIIERFPGSLYEAPTSILLTCILNHCPPSPELQQAFTKLATLVTKPFAETDSAPNLVETHASNLMFKKIIGKDMDRKKAGQPMFTTVLMPYLNEDSLDCWLRCNRGCVLLIAIFNLEIKELSAELQTKLKTYKTIISKLKSKSGEVLREKLASM